MSDFDKIVDKLCSWRWFWKFCETLEIHTMKAEFTVKEVAVFRVATLQMKHFTK